MRREAIMLTSDQVTKFQRLYRNRYGKEISREEAYEQGIKLMRLVELIYKPMAESEYLYLQKRRQETGFVFTREVKREVN